MLGMRSKGSRSGPGTNEEDYGKKARKQVIQTDYLQVKVIRAETQYYKPCKH